MNVAGLRSSFSTHQSAIFTATGTDAGILADRLRYSSLMAIAATSLLTPARPPKSLASRPCANRWHTLGSLLIETV